MISQYWCPDCDKSWSVGVDDGWTDNSVTVKKCADCEGICETEKAKDLNMPPVES